MSATRPPAEDDALAVARARVLEQARRDPSVLGAFVCGSTAQGGGCRTRDVDLRVVLHGGERFEPRKGAYEQVDGALLDWSFQHVSEYADVDALLRNSWLCPNVVEAVVLYDPSGFLEDVCGRVRARYGEAEGLRARVTARLEKFARFESQALETARAGDYFGLLSAVLVLPKFATSVPAVLACRTPTTRRRMFVARAALASLGRPDLFAALEDFYELRRVTADDLLRGLDDVMRLYDRANAAAQVALDRQPDLVEIRGVIDPLKREYWRDGIGEMIADGCLAEALSPLVHVGLIAMVVLAASRLDGSSLAESAGDTGLLRRLGFVGARSLLAKARALAPYRQALVSVAEARLGPLPVEARA